MYNLCIDEILDKSNLKNEYSLKCLRLILELQLLFVTRNIEQSTPSFFLWQILHTMQNIICFRKHVLETTTSRPQIENVYLSYISCTGNEEYLRDCKQRGSCSSYYYRNSVVILTCNAGEWLRCFNLSNEAYVISISCNDFMEMTIIAIFRIILVF